jgi:hypothetical protein
MMKDLEIKKIILYKLIDFIIFIISYISLFIHIIFALICWLFTFGSIPIYVKFRLTKDPKGSFRYIKFNKL